MSRTVDDSRLRIWLQQVAEGDTRALRHLYDALAPSIYRFALSRLDDPHEADGIVSEVMVQVWQQAGRFEGRASVLTWVLGIAHHKVMDVWRRIRRGSEELDTVQPARPLDQALSETATPADEGEHAALNEACQACFDACLAQLPPAQRQALYLALVEEQPYQDIARILDCPTNTVKTRVFHARRFMQQCMAAWRREKAV